MIEAELKPCYDLLRRNNDLFQENTFMDKNRDNKLNDETLNKVAGGLDEPGLIFLNSNSDEYQKYIQFGDCPYCYKRSPKSIEFQGTGVHICICCSRHFVVYSSSN